MSYLWSSLRILVISYFASWGSITSRQAIGARVTLQNRVAQFVHCMTSRQLVSQQASTMLIKESVFKREEFLEVEWLLKDL